MSVTERQLFRATSSTARVHRQLWAGEVVGVACIVIIRVCPEMPDMADQASPEPGPEAPDFVTRQSMVAVMETLSEIYIILVAEADGTPAYLEKSKYLCDGPFLAIGAEIGDKHLCVLPIKSSVELDSPWLR
jgi:hypothetical protein